MMAPRKKNKAKLHKQAHPTSPIEIIIRQKAKKFIEAERQGIRVKAKQYTLQ